MITLINGASGHYFDRWLCPASVGRPQRQAKNHIFAAEIVSLALAASVSFGAANAKPCTSPPVSPGDGMVPGISINNRSALLFWGKDAQLGGFDCFENWGQYFPQVLVDGGSLAPMHQIVDMAYAATGTMTFYNVVVPAAGVYRIKFRYAFGSGLFPGVTDRAEGIKVNGSVADSNMHFLITGSMEKYCHSAINVQLDAGRNTVQVYNISQHGVARADDMTIAPATGPITPVGGLPPPPAPTECNSLP